MNNSKTKKLVMAALLAALCCVATMIIKIPSPLKGYLNLGDCVVLLAGWLLSPLYGFLAAGAGSACGVVLFEGGEAFGGFLRFGLVGVLIFLEFGLQFGDLFLARLVGRAFGFKGFEPVGAQRALVVVGVVVAYGWCGRRGLRVGCGIVCEGLVSREIAAQGEFAVHVASPWFCWVRHVAWHASVHRAWARKVC